MAHNPFSTTSNTQEITITSIRRSIDELRMAIAVATRIKMNNATTSDSEGGGSNIVDEKESFHHEIHNKNEESSEESESDSICNVLPKWVLSCGTGKKEDNRSSQDRVRVVDSSHGEDTSLMEKLYSNLDKMVVALWNLKIYEEELLKKIKRANQNSIEALKMFIAAELSGAGSSLSFGPQEVIQELLIEVRKLRHQIPSLHKSSFKDSVAHYRHSGSIIDGVHTNMEIYNSPSMQMSKIFTQSSVFTEIKEIYEGLNGGKQKCLLCFAVFPENEEIKKRTLTYWWEGEGLLPQLQDGEPVEKLARDILDDFVKEDLIEPIYKKGRKKVTSYRMNSIVHGVVVKIAEEENFFLYDGMGTPTAIFEQKAEKGNPICKKVCLLKAQKGTATPQQQEKKGKGKKQGRKNMKEEVETIKNMMEEVETIFNFNEPFPDLRIELFAEREEADVAEWLLKMKNLKVLHLGRWQASAKHRIEVQKTDFLDGFKKMKNLRLLSLQGVSGIKKLTSSIEGLTNVKILDLKACHNLEELPEEISKLTNLTHLDVSDCYLIEYMPKGLSYLKNLQVLKGFVVGDEQIQKTQKYCSLDGLKHMKKLRKLSLNISKLDFPTKEELATLGKLGSLKTLKMSWGVDLNPEKNEAVKGKVLINFATSEPQLPPGLKKLDLLYFPHEKSPTWLMPEKLPKLLKLSIRKGHFGELKKNQQKWSVKTLRLKFLNKLKMSWEELQVEFPNLECLEKVGCPRITFCPCDANGVWVRPNLSEEESYEISTVGED